MVGTLLEAGAEVSVRDESHNTPLHFATFGGFAVVARMLLAAGADVQALDRDGGQTALHVASRRGHGGLVRMLVDAGADVAVKPKTLNPTPYALHLDSSTVNTKH